MILTFSVGISKNAKIHMIEGDSDGPHSYNSFLKLCHKCNKKNKQKNKTSKGMIFMKKFKKIIAMGCAVVMAVFAMNIGAFAATNKTEIAKNNAVEAGYTVIDNMIDYSIYDEDMVYIKEHADKVAEYNAALKARRSINAYSAWDWDSDGIFTRTTRSAMLVTINYYFTPVNNYLYFNAEVTGAGTEPYLATQKLNSDGSLTYVGSFEITSKNDGTYEWSNYKRALTKGQNYVFSLCSRSGNWSYSSLDIYKTAM